MPENVEIKARVHNVQELADKAKALSESEGVLIEQRDVFFNTPQGRLKLRYLKDEPSQLIYYERADSCGPKSSSYYIASTNQPDELANVLGRALGIKGEVVKRRFLYMVGQTRVHIDDIKGLGNFMELEVQMKDNQTLEEGQKIAEDLMSKLGVEQNDLVTGAYMDLICATKES